MVSIDFPEYDTFSTCPIWWQNFILATIKDITGTGTYIERYAAIDEAIAEYHGVIIDEEKSSDNVLALEFETQDDFNAFKLIWTMYGE